MANCTDAERCPMSTFTITSASCGEEAGEGEMEEAEEAADDVSTTNSGH